jgi:antitoxin PrlF
MAPKTKVTRKYQITIPQEVRKKVGVEVGDEFKVSAKGENIILEKSSEPRDLLSFAGCWNEYPEDPEEFMKDLRKLWSNSKV